MMFTIFDYQALENPQRTKAERRAFLNACVKLASGPEQLRTMPGSVGRGVRDVVVAELVEEVGHRKWQISFAGHDWIAQGDDERVSGREADARYDEAVALGENIVPGDDVHDDLDEQTDEDRHEEQFR